MGASPKKCLSDFWYAYDEKNPPSLGIDRLALEIQRLPPLRELGTHDLKRIVLTFRLYQEKNRRDVLSSPVIGLWNQIKKDWFHRANNIMEIFHYEEKASFLLSLSHLLTRPASNFRENFFREFQKDIPECKSKELSSVAFATSHLAVPFPKNFSIEFALQAKRIYSTFPIEGKVGLFKSYAVQSTLTTLPEEVFEICRDFREVLKNETTSQGGKMPLDKENSCFEACLRLFPDEEPFFRAGAQTIIESYAEKEFFNHLINSGFCRDDTLRNLSVLKTKTDYAFFCGQTPVLMEFDGPHHYVMDYESGNLRLNGSTRLKTANIVQTNRDAVLIRVGFKKAKELSDFRGRNRLEALNCELRNPKYAPPGAYVLHYSGWELVLAPLRIADLHHQGQPFPPSPRNNGDKSPAQQYG